VVPSTFFPSLFSETLLLQYHHFSQENQSVFFQVASLHHIRFKTLFYKVCDHLTVHSHHYRPSNKPNDIMSSIKSLALLALATGFASVANAATGKTTRYWDCCKGSCSWPGKAAVSAPITTCDKNDNPLTDANTPSACDGGSAYMCSDQSPWAVSDDLAYGFAAANIAGGSEDSWCCSCYK
jgi:hypothetical protein